MKKIFVFLALLTSLAAVAQPSCIICEIDPIPPAPMMFAATTDFAMVDAPVLQETGVLTLSLEFASEQWSATALELSNAATILTAASEPSSNLPENKTEGRVRDHQIPVTAPRQGSRPMTVLLS